QTRGQLGLRRQRRRGRSFRFFGGLLLLSLTGLAFALGLGRSVGLGGLLGLVRLFSFISHQSLPMVSPQRRQTRVLAPSAAVLRPTRTGALHRSQKIMTFEMSIGASFSTIPPGLCAPRGLLCRLTILSRSMTTRPRSGSTRITLPVLPRSRPVTTITVSFFLILYFADAITAPPARARLFSKTFSRAAHEPPGRRCACRSVRDPCRAARRSCRRSGYNCRRRG